MSGCALLTRARAEHMPAPELARAMLGDARADAVRSAELSFWPFYDLHRVALKEAPERVGPDLCRMRVHDVTLAPDDAEAAFPYDRHTSMHVVRVETTVRLGIARPGGGCPDRTGGYIDPGVTPGDRVPAILHRLAAARAAAAAPGPLPFRLTCRLAGADAMWCAEGGRRALATLSFDQLDMLRPVQARTCARTVFAYPNGPCTGHDDASPVVAAGWAVDPNAGALIGWEITLPNSAADLSWVIGIGPGDGFETIDMEPDRIDYH